MLRDIQNGTVTGSQWLLARRQSLIRKMPVQDAVDLFARAGGLLAYASWFDPKALFFSCLSVPACRVISDGFFDLAPTGVERVIQRRLVAAQDNGTLAFRQQRR